MWYKKYRHVPGNRYKSKKKYLETLLYTYLGISPSPTRHSIITVIYITCVILRRDASVYNIQEEVCWVVEWLTLVTCEQAMTQLEKSHFGWFIKHGVSVITHVFKVADGFVCRPCVDDFSFVHECEVIKLPEDGVAWLVNGEDDGLALFGEPEQQTVCVKTGFNRAI